MCLVRYERSHVKGCDTCKELRPAGHGSLDLNKTEH